MAFSQDKADAICERIASGESLRKAAAAEGVSDAWMLKWVGMPGFDALREQYARAMIARADVKFEELEDVSESAVVAETAVEVAGLRLKSDNIKWMIGKMNAKKYGDKIETTHEVGDSIRAVVREIVKPGA